MNQNSLHGCIGESRFSYECLTRNIPVFKPVADLYGIDFIAGIDQLFKIQVKSTTKKDTRYNTGIDSYKICVRHGANSIAYKDQFDYLAVYLMPIDLFYIIPISELNKTTIRITPVSDRCKFSGYKARWDLIQGIPPLEYPD